MTAPSNTYKTRQRLAGRPGGSRLFSAAVMGRGALFRVDSAAHRADGAGPAEIKVPKWFFVSTHVAQAGLLLQHDREPGSSARVGVASCR